jgi:hypothetical protein
MSSLNDLEKYLKTTLNRVRCPVCYSSYVDSLCLVDAEGIRFRFKPGRAKFKCPIINGKSGNRPIKYQTKLRTVEETARLSMVCPLCGVARTIDFVIFGPRGIIKH